MRTILLAAILLLVSAGTAGAADVTILARDVPLHGGRSLAAAAPARFDLVGLHWQGSGRPLFRTRSLSGRWSGWLAADDDWGRDSSGWRKGAAEWTGAADAIQYRLEGRVERLRAYFLWSPVERLPARRLSLAGSPTIIPRSAWGADESIRKVPPVYVPAIRFALIHHTVSLNSYSPAESAAIVRGIYVYHVKGNGWNDIGYNFLVDKYGQVFEGRYGGIERAVVGAHSLGFNRGSVGVALIGNYNGAGLSQAAHDSLVKLLAWRLDVAHVDPLSFVNVLSGGNLKFPVGIPVNLRAISGHRDTYFTECPGNALYAQIPSIAQAVAAAGGPKLYAPAVQGKAGNLLRYTGKLSTSLPWTVTIADSTGASVAKGAGRGTAIDWTYDSSATPPGRYAWTIAAGPSVRPATGAFTVKGVPVSPLLLADVSASPAVISPNGDLVDDSATIAYTLGAPASVTAALVNAAGVAGPALFSDLKQLAGKQSFVFTGDGVADGPYTIAITATPAEGVPVTLSAPLTIDRTLAGYAVTPAFGPAGNGPTKTLVATFSLVYPASGTLQILDSGGNVVATPFTGPLAAGAETLTWDGALPDGSTLADGSYSAALVLAEPAGTVTHALPFTADSTAPVLTLVSARALEFRVSEPGTVTLTVRGSPWIRYVKKVEQAGLVSFWVSAVQPTRFTAVARDATGNVSAVVLHL